MTKLKKPDSQPAQRSIASFFGTKIQQDGLASNSQAFHSSGTDGQHCFAPSDPTPHKASKAPSMFTGHSMTNYGSEMIGSRLSVYWPLERSWFEGKVISYDQDRKKHRVDYDDGDVEWLRLTKERFKVLQPGQSTEASEQDRAGLEAEQMLPVPLEEEAGDDTASEGGDSGSDWEEEELANPPGESEDDGSDLGEEEEEDLDDASEGADELPPPDPRRGGAKRRLGGAPVQRRPAKRAAARPHSPRPAAAASSAAHLEVPTPCPPPGAKESLALALREAPPAAASAPPTGSAPTRELIGEAARFAARDAERFRHLLPDNLRDAGRKRPSDPGYDPRTLFIPPSWFRDWKVSEGQKQWWEFKAANFDSVLLFKMGKFYEMFEMDAHIGAEVLGLSYMKGDQPHCGFPEKNYHQNAELLARSGHRVVVIEQTETPEMLARRNEERQRRGEKKATVVRREKVAVLTRATMMDPEMLASNPEASYLLAAVEFPNPEGGLGLPVRIGVAVADCPTGEIVLGQWADDELRSRLRAHLTAFKPVEVVMPRSGFSRETEACIRGCLRGPRWSALPDASWDPGAALQTLREGAYFETWPRALQELEAAGDGGTAALAAIGGLSHFLAEALLDRAVLPLGRVSLLPKPERTGAGSGCDEPEFMALDGAALENLEVLENVEGGVEGTLVAALDNCATACGRRRLRQWLLRPLGRLEDIEARQDAVEDLMGPAADAAGEARRHMGGTADLERGVARLQAAASAGSGRDGDRVVLYEDQGRRRVASMVAVLKGLKGLRNAVACFDGVRGSLRSRLLCDLVTPGRGFPDMAEALDELEQATDWEAAAESGKAVPSHKGVDTAYDEAEERCARAAEALQVYLERARAEVGPAVKFASANKDSHLLEVPEEKAARVPIAWELRGQRKGFRRYMSPELAELVAEHDDAQQEMERAATGILTGLARRFSDRAELWSTAVSAASQLDALASLAQAAVMSHIPTCRPKFVRSAKPFFDARSLHHPAGIAGRQGCFVPNDVSLGGCSKAPFLLLTGPNMGGKSTLLRQVSLAAVMAQVGAWVPAESLTLSPIDAVYVRMGARDHILAGQSTFMVELSETSAMLRNATPRSLVLLDELGRGTSTSDGAAIAAAVLSHVVRNTGCLGMFATHYHRLSEDHKDDPSVLVCHMGARITPGRSKSEPDEVCFLYKLTPGACPKSYGHNVARLAGLPASVVANASAKARAMEEAVCNRMPNHLGESDSSLEIVAEAIVTAVSAGLPEKVREVWKKLSHGLV